MMPKQYAMLCLATRSIPNVLRKLPYDALKDFTPITTTTTAPMIMIVNPSVPAKTVGIMGPAGLARNIVDLINAETHKVLRLPEVQERLAASGIEAMPTSPEEFRALLHAEYARWGKVVKGAGIKPNEREGAGSAGSVAWGVILCGLPLRSVVAELCRRRSPPLRFPATVMQPRRPRRLHPSAPPARRPDAGQRTALPPAASAGASPEPGMVRLSKRMAAMGLCSRREADEWIEKGWVRVNGERITQLGTRVLPEQRITIERAARVEQEQRVTLLLHKPVGYVSGQAEDGHQPASTLITAANLWKDDPSGIDFRPAHLRSLAPAGRLDIDSTGLLVLTQDGRIARRLIGADAAMEKEYLVRVAGTLSPADLARLNHGLMLDGVPLRRAEVSWLNEDQLRFVVTEGRNRQIRRMCEQVGLRVLGLKRVRIGRVMLGHLPRGQWRYLHHDEQF